MGQVNRQRHQSFGLVACVTKHHSLVASTLKIEVIASGASTHFFTLVDTLCDVGRLCVERNKHATGLAIKTKIGIGVTNALDDFASSLSNINVSLGGDFTRDQTQASCHQSFASDTSMWVLREDRVEHRIRNLVGDLVGVTFGHALGSECPVTTHDGSVSSLSMKEMC